MGRRLKYKTEDEKREVQKKWSLEYYHRNKDKIDKNQKRRYWLDKFTKEGIVVT